MKKISTNVKETTVVAHNMKSYDGQFFLSHMVKMGLEPKLILNGSKLMLFSSKNLTFKDSLNFLPMPLSGMPKALNLGDQFKKGGSPTCSTDQRTGGI